MTDLIPRPWHSVCNNPMDFFTLEPFSDESEGETLKIHYIDVDKIECFNREILQNYFKSLSKFEIEEDGNEPKLVDGPMVEYVPRTTLRNVDDSGHGMKPLEYSAYYYRNPGQYGGYFTEVLVSEIMTNRGEVIKVERYPNLIRLGNIGGIFGVSMLHGQAPGETIYKSVNEIFSRNIVHESNWEAEIDRDCGGDFDCKDDNPSCVNVYIGDSYYKDIIDVSIDNFNSKLTDEEINQTEIQNIKTEIKYYEDLRKSLTEHVVSVDGHVFAKQPEIGRVSNPNKKRPIFPLKFGNTCIFINNTTRVAIVHPLHKDISLVPFHILAKDTPTIIMRIWIFTAFRPLIEKNNMDNEFFDETIKRVFNRSTQIYNISSNNEGVYKKFSHEVMDDVWKFIAPNNIPIYNSSDDFYDISFFIVVINKFWKLYGKDDFIDLVDKRYNLNEFIGIISKNSEYDIKRLRNASAKNNPVEYCDNKFDIQGRDIKEINFENFLLLSTPAGKSYCYDIHALVKYVLNSKENINPYDRSDSIWKEEEFIKISEDPRINDTDGEQLKDIFENIEMSDELIIQYLIQPEISRIFVFIGCLGYYMANSRNMLTSKQIIEIVKSKITKFKTIFNNLRDFNNKSLKTIINDENPSVPDYYSSLLDVFLFNLLKLYDQELDSIVVDTVQFIKLLSVENTRLECYSIRNNANEINLDAITFDINTGLSGKVNMGKYTSEKFSMNDNFFRGNDSFRKGIEQNIDLIIDKRQDWLKAFSFKMELPQLFGEYIFFQMNESSEIHFEHHSKIPPTQNIGVKLIDGNITRNIKIDQLTINTQNFPAHFKGEDQLRIYQLSIMAYCALRLIKINPKTTVKLLKIISYKDRDPYPVLADINPILEFSDFQPSNGEMKKYLNDIIMIFSNIRQFYLDIERRVEEFPFMYNNIDYQTDIIDIIDMSMFVIVGNDAIARDIELATVIVLINIINKHESRSDHNGEIYHMLSSYFNVPVKKIEHFHLKFRYSYAYQYDEISYIKDIINKLPTDANGNTPLHQASMAGAKEIVEGMITADINETGGMGIAKTNNAGKTALDIINEILSQPPENRPNRDFDRIKAILINAQEEFDRQSDLPEYARLPWPTGRNISGFPNGISRLQEMPIGTKIFLHNGSVIKKISKDTFNDNEIQIYQINVASFMIEKYGVKKIILPDIGKRVFASFNDEKSENKRVKRFGK